jgi:hypothetical protein
VGDGMITGRIICHMAVHAEKRAAAAQMDELSGNPSEFSIPLVAVGGDAVAWGTLKGYGTAGFGASQALSQAVGQAMMVSGYQEKTEVSFALYFEDTLQPVPNGCNLSVWPTGPTYDEFLTAGGWNKVQPEGPV